jgi:hypothetical protein
MASIFPILINIFTLCVVAVFLYLTYVAYSMKITIPQLIDLILQKKKIESVQVNISALEKIQEMFDDRTAIGSARARVMPRVKGSFGGFTAFDRTDDRYENHLLYLQGSEIDFVDTIAMDKERLDILKSEGVDVSNLFDKRLLA